MSVTQTRRDRERAAREALILDHAQRMLLQGGYQALILDELARAVEYSKGTLYLHFKTKEDLVLAVATRALKERADLFERAAAFPGRTRERARAMGVACVEFARNHQDYFNVEMMLKSVSFWEKASPERRQQHGIHASRAFHAVNNVVMDGLRVGDLPPGLRAVEVTMSLIAVTMGSHIVATEPELQLLSGIDDPLAAMRKYQDRLCDGWGWQPLEANWDYRATDRRIHDGVFPGADWLLR